MKIILDIEVVAPPTNKNPEMDRVLTAEYWERLRMDRLGWKDPHVRISHVEEMKPKLGKKQ